MSATNLEKPQQALLDSIIHCDKRIASLQFKKDLLEYHKSVREQLFNMVSNEEKEIFEPTPRELNRIQNMTNAVSLVKIERMCYSSLLNQSIPTIYPRLLSKYDELMGVAYELASDAVLMNVVKETDYLDFCRESLKQRDFIKIMCDGRGKIVLCAL
jgi:hypothetical protein